MISKDRVSLSLCMTLFFLCGFSTVLNVILIPHLQSVLSLRYTPVALIQVSFYVAYFLFSPLTGYLFQNRNYLEGIRTGLFIGSLGALILYWASLILSYPLILLGIFILGGGIAALQVTGNPYTLLIGTQETASSQLTLAQAFTSLGTILAPYFGSLYFLSQTNGHTLYLILTLMWCLTFFFALSAPLLEAKEPVEKYVRNPFYEPFVLFGALAMAVSTGMEVTISSYLTRFISETADLPLASAGKLMMIFWIGFFLGRVLGSRLLARYSAYFLITISAYLGISLTFITVTTSGYIATAAILLTGLSLSLLFPLLFSEILKNCQSPRGAVSGILCMANIGGAIFPLIQGYLADSYTLHRSFTLPIFGFLYLLFFANYLRTQFASTQTKIIL